MSKAEFIKAIREMADELENGGFAFINLPSGYVFGNRNFGEVHCNMAEGISVSIHLYEATEEERKGGEKDGN